MGTGTKIIECPYCRGNRIGCDYCGESGLMDLYEIYISEQMDKCEEDEDE